MGELRASSSRIEDLVAYDPKYYPARARLAANENPLDVAPEIRRLITREFKKTPLNRYPDPMANELRDMIAEANGLDREWIMVGNGADELLLDIALAWGGPGRTYMNLPPTFSSYATNAQLTATTLVEIPRTADYSIDEEAVLSRMSQGDVDFMIVSSPNNPTGLLAPSEFSQRLLESTDALVVFDEAYFEFSRQTMRPFLEANENLVVVRTFSKAFSLAGVRVGYLLAHPTVVRELEKVRQPFSVDCVSQAIARVVYENRAAFEQEIVAIAAERDRMFQVLCEMPNVTPYRSDANWVLFKIDNASQAWQYLYDNGVLVRDFSATPMLEDSLRVSVGTHEENDMFLRNLRSFVTRS